MGDSLKLVGRGGTQLIIVNFLLCLSTAHSADKQVPGEKSTGSTLGTSPDGIRASRKDRALVATLNSLRRGLTSNIGPVLLRGLRGGGSRIKGTVAIDPSLPQRIRSGEACDVRYSADLFISPECAPVRIVVVTVIRDRETGTGSTCEFQGAFDGAGAELRTSVGVYGGFRDSLPVGEYEIAFLTYAVFGEVDRIELVDVTATVAIVESRFEKSQITQKLRSLIQSDAPEDELSLEVQHLIENERMNDDVVAAISAVRDLKSLNLRRTAITDGSMQHLQRLTALRSLTLDDTAVTDEAMTSIGALSGLRSLSLRNTDVSDRGVEASIGKLEALEFLDLTGTEISSKSMRVIAGLPHLRALRVGETDVGDSGLAALAAAGQIESLHLTSTLVTDVGIRSLGRLEKLKRLCVGGTRLGDEGVEALRRMTGLTSVCLVNTKVTVPGLCTLASLPNLQELWVSEARLSELPDHLRGLVQRSSSDH